MTAAFSEGSAGTVPGFRVRWPVPGQKTVAFETLTSWFPAARAVWDGDRGMGHATRAFRLVTSERSFLREGVRIHVEA